MVAVPRGTLPLLVHEAAHYMCYAWGEGGSAFHFRALLTEKMEKEHAHINGGGCNMLATCLLSSS